MSDDLADEPPAHWDGAPISLSREIRNFLRCVKDEGTSIDSGGGMGGGSVQGVLKAALGINVTGAGKDAMDAACGVLGGIGTALPAGADPATVKAMAVALKPA